MATDRAEPLLLLLNGPPGVGKSTLARRYADDHPLTLNLDVDLLRRQLGAWRDHEQDSGRLAREAALAAIRAHLSAGHDVVVPQFLRRPELAQRLEALADELGCRFVEVVLMVPVDVALERFAGRSAAAAEPAHLEAAEVVRRDGGEEQLRRLHSALLEFVATRPDAILIDVSRPDADAAYGELLAALAMSGSRPSR